MTLVDPISTIDEYLDRSDWRVNANANQDYSIGGLILNSAGKVTANYWLEAVFSDDASVAHRSGDIHIHDLDMLSGYCAGWSLRGLLEEGFNGVEGTISAGPPKHFSSAVGQIVNFLGTMQNEWAGAQAFSSFDTYMAPFVRLDDLSYDEVRQNIQEMIFNLNVPSRWGCVDADTEVLSKDGWKKWDDLEEGEDIYSFDEKTGRIVLNPVNKVVTKQFKGKLQSYQGRNYNQTVTPNHRVLTYDHNSRNPRIRLSEDIFDVKTPYALPVKADGLQSKSPFTDDEVTLAAMIYTDGSLDRRGESLHKVNYFKSENRWGAAEFSDVCDALGLDYTVTEKVSDIGAEKGYGPYFTQNFRLYGDSGRYVSDLVGCDLGVIDPKFFDMNGRQARLFLDVWARHDGDVDKLMLQVDNEEIFSAIQQIAMIAGYTSYKRVSGGEGKAPTTYVKLRKVESIIPTERTEVDYDGVVWCPSVDAGTAIFRKNGSVYISGQSQSPFTNLTMDWVCPDDLKDTHPIIGGVEQDFTYGDLQDEMDVVNKAFMDVMIEGDANGRVFTFPIPTYNITKDFDWDSPNSDMLFGMTAKYGLPYFQNFVNSDLDPAMIRSMCPLTSDTEVIVRTKGWGVRKAPISDIVFGMEKGTKYEVWTPSGWKGAEPVRAEASEAYKFTLSNGLSVSMGENHLQPVRDRGTISARDIQVGDWLPYSRTGFHNADLGTYDLGYAVGAYMGDGSVHDSILTYSLNETTKISLKDELVKFWESMGYKTRVYGSQLRVLGHAGDVVRRYVGGKTSLDKHLKDLVYDMGIPFREGLLQGWADTDGSQSRNRVYTASREAAGDMVTLAVTLGRKARLGDKDTRDGRLGTSAVYRVDLPERDNYGDVFQGDEEYHYYRVESIEPLGVKNNLYCFEVQDDDHLFTLADGLTTHNCRLQLDMTELLKRGNGLFGSAELTGSIGVVTVNMARLGYLYRGDWDALVQELDRLIDVASDTLEKRRDVVQENMDRGLYPFTKRYLGHLNNHFSTIGVNGINEMIRNYTGDVLDITDPEGHDMAAEVLDHIRERMTELQESTGNMYNLEATPAEGTTYRFAKEDKELYPDIIQAGTDEQPYYTNSSQLPVGYTDDPFQALKEQDELQGKYTGGTVLHLYMGEKMSSTEATKQMVKRALTNHRLPYITVTPTFSICPVHGYLSGEHELCPKCDEPQECEVWTRVMGYFRPVASYNIGKKGEYAERVEFAEQV